MILHYWQLFEIGFLLPHTAAEETLSAVPSLSSNRLRLLVIVRFHTSAAPFSLPHGTPHHSGSQPNVVLHCFGCPFSFLFFSYCFLFAVVVLAVFMMASFNTRRGIYFDTYNTKAFEIKIKQKSYNTRSGDLLFSPEVFLIRT